MPQHRWEDLWLQVVWLQVVVVPVVLLYPCGPDHH
eukprot:SAG25_NODE_5838_length_616_cov_0.599613_1_plen_34_part_10